MITAIHPKLPMRDKNRTRLFYQEKLGFVEFGDHDYPSYLMLTRDGLQVHFFVFAALDPMLNYGQVYLRTQQIDALYAEFLARQVAIHPNGPLETKAWGQREFSVLDPDNNLLTFGQTMEIG